LTPSRKETEMFKTVVKILQMHYGLVKYLNVELRKKRTLRELIYFLRVLAKRYFQVNLQEYKKLFLILDPEYQKQKKEYDNHNKVKADLQRALKILQYIDRKMVKEGKSRQEIRQVWRDFVSRGETREEMFNAIKEELK
jgi:hypothetical protein